MQLRSMPEISMRRPERDSKKPLAARADECRNHPLVQPRGQGDVIARVPHPVLQRSRAALVLASRRSRIHASPICG